ncbi:hypothetical protein BHM03_00048423 [Ensete ventricosum]|nr:hypothetical protein BHM03_00048423 [Ensete ventricosum]
MTPVCKRPIHRSRQLGWMCNTIRARVLFTSGPGNPIDVALRSPGLSVSLFDRYEYGIIDRSLMVWGRRDHGLPTIHCYCGVKKRTRVESRVDRV